MGEVSVKSAQAVCTFGNGLQAKIKYHDPYLPKLCQTEQGDWIDLRAAEHVEMKAGEFRIIPLGISVQIPRGFEAHIAPRSSTFKRWGVIQVNGVGVVDESYSGNDDIWGMPVLAMRDTVIEFGDRIAQFRFVQKMGCVLFEEVDDLEGPSRGGFGSTGAR